MYVTEDEVFEMMGLDWIARSFGSEEYGKEFCLALAHPCANEFIRPEEAVPLSGGVKGLLEGKSLFVSKWDNRLEGVELRLEADEPEWVMPRGEVDWKDTSHRMEVRIQSAVRAVVQTRWKLRYPCQRMIWKALSLAALMQDIKTEIESVTHVRRVLGLCDSDEAPRMIDAWESVTARSQLAVRTFWRLGSNESRFEHLRGDVERYRRHQLDTDLMRAH